MNKQWFCLYKTVTSQILLMWRGCSSNLEDVHFGFRSSLSWPHLTVWQSQDCQWRFLQLPWHIISAQATTNSECQQLWWTWKHAQMTLWWLTDQSNWVMCEYPDDATCWGVLGDIRYQMGSTGEPLRATLGLQFQLVKHVNLLYRFF